MIRSGAKGYLLKTPIQEILKLHLPVSIVMAFFYPDWASKIIFSNLNKETESEIAIRISDREKEFLKYTVTELSYKEIADRMCCSPRTVESYRDQLCEKLDLKTRVGFAVLPLKMVSQIRLYHKKFFQKQI